MKRIALAMLSLLAVACSKDIDEVYLEPTGKEPVAETPKDDPEDNTEHTGKENPEASTTNTVPVFEQKTYTVEEHTAAGSKIGAVLAMDADLDQITYALVSDIDLVIDENTGEITLGPQLILDFETNPTLSFTVAAFDGKAIVEMSFDIDISNIDEVSILTQEEESLIEHFQYLTLWQGPHVSEVETNRRWNNAMLLYLDGTISNEFEATVAKVLADYNALFEDSDFSISLTEDAEAANGHLFFGTQAEVEDFWPDMYDLIQNGNYDGYAMTPSQNNVLVSTRIWISNPIESLVKHEIGHALGLGHSNRCEDEKSIMCSQISADSNFTTAEEDVFRLLYSSNFTAGLSATEIEALLADMLVNRR